MLQLVDEVVLGVMGKVGAKIGTKGLTTITIKDMEITIVPIVVINTTVAMVAMIILGVTMGTMNMDRDTQTTVANRDLWQGIWRGWQSPKQLPAILKEDIGENRRKLLKLTHFAGPHCRLLFKGLKMIVLQKTF